MTRTENVELEEVDGVEIVSLVDNTVDFLSSISHKQSLSFRQWTRERNGQGWMNAHNKLPLAEHGFSMLIRVFNDEKADSILFDTGGSPEAIVENTERMGISLSEAGCIVMSHGHYDHCGGLLSAVKAVGKVGLPIIVHEDMFRIRGTAYSNRSIRKYSQFPAEAQLSPAHCIKTKQPFLIADNMACVTGEIPRETSFEKGRTRHRAFINGIWQPDPLILDDRAIVINVRGKGLVILSGCAHAGIINTVTYAQRISGITDVHAVIGGFHLAGEENENRIKQTIKELKRISPELIVPSHCTGWRGTCAIAKALPHAFVYNSVGNLYNIQQHC